MVGIWSGRTVSSRRFVLGTKGDARIARPALSDLVSGCLLLYVLSGLRARKVAEKGIENASGARHEKAAPGRDLRTEARVIKGDGRAPQKKRDSGR